MGYRFGPFRLEPGLDLLFRGDEPLGVGPRAVALLRALLDNAGAPVSKEALIEAVWGGLAVEESNLTVQIGALRRAFSQEAGGEAWIETLPRRGYRFIGPLAVSPERHDKTVPLVTTSRDGAVERRPQLSIVVLPFVNNSSDPEQEYFVDGLTENLTIDLSRLAGSFVIGRNTAFTYKGKPTDLKQIGRELNVRYVLEGSVQRGSNRIRVNVELIDAETGADLWTERFDKPVDDLFEMQDEIVARLANELSTALIVQEARRTARAPNPDSMDHYFQGMAWYEKAISLPNITEARRCFERALELDPDNVDALVQLANVDIIFDTVFNSDDRATRRAAAEASLKKALSLAPSHALGHFVQGFMHTGHGRAEEGIAEFERALELDHNLARAHAWIGNAKSVLGHAEETEAHVREALRFSPKDSVAYVWMTFAGLAKLCLGADEEAVVWLRRSIEANRNFMMSHFTLAAALAHLGRLDEAQAAAKAGLTLDPTATIQRVRTVYRGGHPVFMAQRERLLEGMRIAGVPES